MNALALVVLYARTDSPKFEAAAVGWLARYALEGRDVRLADVQVAAAAFALLRGLRTRRRSRRSCGCSEAEYAPMTMGKFLRRVELMTLPSWVAGPLVLLGLMFLIAKPFGIVDEWFFYVYSLVLAALLALYIRWRYEISVVERSDEWVLVRCGLRRSSSGVRQPKPDQLLGE